MKIYVPKLFKEGIGGGNTFVANFSRNLPKEYQLQESIDGADLMFVANPMWAERSDFEACQQKGIPSVLRVDNIPEDWNNRGTAITKLRDFTSWASHVIFQSEWARQKYLEFGSKDGTVILNGVDVNLFSPTGETMEHQPFSPRILFVKSSRNENKRYPEGMEMFRRYYKKNQNSKLYLIGQFADDYHKYNFGFYNGENYQYLGMQPIEIMPMIYRSVDILFFPAFADAAPNVVLEAMACGVVPIIHPYGGAVEYTEDNRFGVVIDGDYNYEKMITEAMAKSRLELRNHIIENHSAERMVKHYTEVFDGQLI